MNKVELEKRTKEFSLQLIRFLESLPKNYLGESLGRQLLKSGTSIGANYREANRAESKADFIHKLAIVEKEASETLYWLELLLEAGIGANQEAIRLMQEQATVGHIHRRGKNIERPPIISNLEFRYPKSASFWRKSPLGDGTAAVDGKLQGEGLRFLKPAEFFYQGHSHSIL